MKYTMEIRSKLQLSYKLKRALFNSIKCNTYLIARWLARFSINKIQMKHVRILLTYLKVLINAGDNDPKQRYRSRHSNGRLMLLYIFKNSRLEFLWDAISSGVMSFICFYYQALMRNKIKMQRLIIQKLNNHMIALCCNFCDV